MALGWIAAVSGFALAMAGTPGPNNTMMTASGANHGFRRTLPFMSGVAMGVVTIIMVMAMIGASLMAKPPVHRVVKWAGLAYLLWLAWQMGTAPATIARPGEVKAPEGKPLTLMQGALFQLVNPKMWAMVTGAVVTYGSTAGQESPFAIAVTFGIIFGTATFAGTALWALIGVGFKRLMKTERTMRRFNWVMALLMLLSLIPIVTE